MALLVVFLVVIVTGEENAVQNGKIQYEIISRDTRLPRYGDCWKNSLSSLEQGCKALTDELQSRLALKFANCFLAMSGQTTYPCDEEEEISKCLESVDNKAFSAFSNFFTVSLSYLILPLDHQINFDSIYHSTPTTCVNFCKIRCGTKGRRKSLEN